jgi:hypothetical protein
MNYRYICLKHTNQKNMKSLSNGIQALIFFLILSSCEGPKKSPENQPVGGVTTQPAVESKETPQELTPPNTTDSQEKITADGSATFSGAEIVERASSGLVRKLSLTDVQTQKIKGVLTEIFLGMGGDVNIKYPEEKAKTFRKEIVAKSYESILPVLDATQQEQFRKSLLK